MPHAKQTEAQLARNGYARAVNHHGPGSPQAAAAHARLDEANLKTRIRELVDAAPRFTPAIIAELRPLLAPMREHLAGTVGDHGDAA